MTPTAILETFGYIGLFVTIFVETGLLVGFFLPGDTLLLATGITAATGKLNLVLAIAVIAVASFCGDQLGYWIGHRFGPRVFSRPESRLFDPNNVEKARAFFARFGPLAVLIARFVPVMRAFVPTMAGVSRMAYAAFLTYSFLGALLWGSSVTLLGYFLGQAIGPEKLERYILLVLVGGVLAGLLPSLWHIFGPKKKHQ